MMIYMEVTMDEYELPVKVAGSSEELARMCGVRRNTILTCVTRQERGLLKKSKYVRVEVPDREEEE